MTAHEPGVYEAVLQRVCHQQTDNGDEVLKCGTAEELAEVNRRHAERTAALVRERMGSRSPARVISFRVACMRRSTAGLVVIEGCSS